MSITEPEEKHMSFIDTIRDHHRTLRIEDAHQASIERKPAGMSAEAEMVAAQVDCIAESDCDCGGTYDEYDRCSDCANGHDDCSSNDCFACLERAIDRAERMAEGDR